jgi:hypothetical protein
MGLKANANTILCFSKVEFDENGVCQALETVQKSIWPQEALLPIEDVTHAGSDKRIWVASLNRKLLERLATAVNLASWRCPEQVQLLLFVDHEHHFKDVFRK